MEASRQCSGLSWPLRQSSRAGVRIALGVLLAALAATPASANFLDLLFGKRDVQVITVTDATPRGALLRPASPEHPVYYTAASAGYRELGGIIAGEKIPPGEEVIKTIVKVLAKQGYLPATTDHPPSLLLVWTWGTLNTDRFYNPASADSEGRQVNRSQMLRFLGAYKLGLVSKSPNAFPTDPFLPGLIFRDVDAEAIAEAASDDLYVAAIAAYDYPAAARKEKVLLWTTKISCPSRGLLLPETLPAMLAIAGPYIGHDTPKPVSIRATDKFKPDIRIGDPILSEFIEHRPLPVVEVAGPAAKTKPAASAPEKKP